MAALFECPNRLLLRSFMPNLTPLHRVLTRQLSRPPSYPSPIPPLNVLSPRPSHSAALSVFRRRHASSARSPLASPPPTGSKRNRRLRNLGIFTVVGAGALWWDDEYNARTLSRNFRTLWHGAAIALDYKCVLSFRSNFMPNERRARSRGGGLATAVGPNGINIKRISEWY
jgi:hypothetical protein